MRMTSMYVYDETIATVFVTVETAGYFLSAKKAFGKMTFFLQSYAFNNCFYFYLTD